MAEENNTEEVETEEKSLEDQLAALEEVAASLEDDADTKADVSSYMSDDSEGGEEEESAEEESEEESEDEEASDDEASDDEADEASDETEAKDGEPEALEEKDAEVEAVEEEEGVGAKSEEENMEEKIADAVEEVLAEDEKAATLMGFPHDRVVVDDEEQEDDSEELMKPPGGIEDAKDGGPKKRVIVVEMRPEDITEDMKAYVVEVDDDEKVHVPDHMEEDLPEIPEAPEAPVMEDEDDDDGKGWGKKPGKNRLARLIALANGDDDDEKEAVPAPELPTAVLVGKEDESGPMSIYDHLDQEAVASRLERLGTDVKSIGGTDYLCAIERNVRTGDVCNFCRGGCASEKGLPGLLEVEILAEKEFKGEVVDSGYAPKDDIFVLDIKTDDGFIETYYSGNGSSLGWIALDGDVEEKTAEAQGTTIVSFEEAEMVALKNVKGKSLGVDVDIFQGEDAYVVEIDGIDGKSYDAYVGVDGQFLGSDMIELTEEETAEIKELQAEKDVLEAEIELKRSYPSTRTEQLVEDGFAMEDGRFPIVTEKDLNLAIVASSGQKSQDVRDHIISRAEALEATDQIPEEWAEEKAAEEAEFVASLMEMQMMEVEDNLDTE